MTRPYIFLLLVLLLCKNSYASDDVIETSARPMEISGKIMDRNGKQFSDNVSLEITSRQVVAGKMFVGGYKSTEKKDTLNCASGIFKWTGMGDFANIAAIKEGYHSTEVMIVKDMGETVITREGVLIYLIPEGNKSTLWFTSDAYIPGSKDKESGGKQCGWSFKKRWYFPVDGDEPVDIIRSVNENKKRTYTMKEPGGFIYFEGYPKFENNTERNYADFELMPEAPETGYVSTFVPAEHKPDDRDRYFCYFKTPDGKYGKICFSGSLSYYLQPDGSRNLEAGEVIDKGPRNPIEAEWLDKELGKDN